MIQILLNNQWKILRNTIRTQRWQNIFGFFVGTVIIGIFLFFFGRFIWLHSEQMTPDTFNNMFSFALLAIIAMVILMGIPQVFKQLFDSSDLEMLFTMPIHPRSIFWSKYIQSYFGVPLFMFIIFIIPCIVLGIAMQAPFLYYMIMFIALLTATVFGLSLICLLNLFIIQMIPPARANEFMTIMGFVSGVLVYLLIMLPQLSSDRSLIEQMLTGLPDLPKWLPVAWGGIAIQYALEGSLLALLPLGLLILLTVLMMLVTTYLVEKGFRSGWIRMHEGSNKKRRKKKGTSFRAIHHPIVAVGKKEWLTMKRDMREWLTIIPMVVFFIFGMVGFFVGGGRLSDIQGYGEISWPIAQIILLFLCALMNGLISSASIGREGYNLWIIEVMPLTGKYVAYGKLWISWLIPYLFLTFVEVIALFLLNWTFLNFFIGVVVKALITAGLSSFGLWIGTLGAKYNPTNPQQRLSFGAMVFEFVFSYVYLFIALIPAVYLLLPDMLLEEIPKDFNHGLTGVTGILATITLNLLALKLSHTIVMTISAGLLFLLITIGFTYLCIHLSARRIERGLKIDLITPSSSRTLRR